MTSLTVNLAILLMYFGGSPNATSPISNSMRDLYPGPHTPPDIWILNTETNETVRVTNDALMESRPSWSPTDEEIVFSVTNGLGLSSSDIVVYNIAKKERRILAFGSGKDYDPDWSPDGLRIVFTSCRAGGLKLFTAAVDGTEAKCLVDEEDLFCFHPRWSPDGKCIAFCATHKEREHGIDYVIDAIYVIDADGSHLQKLSADFRFPGCAFPSWSRDGHLLLASIVPRPERLWIFDWNQPERRWILDWFQPKREPDLLPLPTVSEYDAWGAGFTPDGKVMMAITSRELQKKTTFNSFSIERLHENRQGEIVLLKIALSYSFSGKQIAYLDATGVPDLPQRGHFPAMPDLKASRKLRDRAVGEIVMGLHGEFILPFRENENTPETDTLYVMNDENKLFFFKLTDASKREDFFVVDKGGTIKALEPATKNFDLTATPQVWPDLNEQAQPVFQKNAPKHMLFAEAGSGISVVPDGKKWLYPSASGALFYPSQQLSRPQNVLYISEGAGSIQLTDSATGRTFLEITNTHRVVVDQYPEWFGSRIPHRVQNLYWPYQRLESRKAAPPLPDRFVQLMPDDRSIVPIEE